MTDTDTDTEVDTDVGTDSDTDVGTETDVDAVAADAGPAVPAAADPDEYDVPADAEVHECAYCGRPFETESLRALHRGLAHEAAIDVDERRAFDEAYAAESGELRRFRLKALGALVVLYFGLLMVYALVV